MEVIRPFLDDLIVSVRHDTAFHRSYLRNNTTDELEEFRALMSEDFRIVNYDNIPGAVLSGSYALVIEFSNGAWADLDVHLDEESVIRAHIWVNASPRLRRILLECAEPRLASTCV